MAESVKAIDCSNTCPWSSNMRVSDNSFLGPIPYHEVDEQLLELLRIKPKKTKTSTEKYKIK